MTTLKVGMGSLLFRAAPRPLPSKNRRAGSPRPGIHKPLTQRLQTEGNPSPKGRVAAERSEVAGWGEVVRLASLSRIPHPASLPGRDSGPR